MGHPGCVFCAIAGRRAPASIIAENPAAIAFLTIGPLRPGHALVIPKRHIVELVEAHPDEPGAVANLGEQVARRLRDRLGSTGETLFLASGTAGEQSVPHLHLQVVPRELGDGIDLTTWWSARARTASRSDLDTVADRLRESQG